jgi:hypothetical protein
MLDMMGAIGGTAIYAVLVAVLVGLSAGRRGAGRPSWSRWPPPLPGRAMIVTLGALGGFAPGATGPVPTPAMAFAAFLTMLLGGWFLFARQPSDEAAVGGRGRRTRADRGYQPRARRGSVQPREDTRLPSSEPASTTA